MSQYIAICRRNFTCFECGRAFKIPQKKSPTKMSKTQTKTTSSQKMKPDKNPQTPPIPKKIKISEVESPPEADTLDNTIHFGDLVVSNRNESLAMSNIK